MANSETAPAPAKRKKADHIYLGPDGKPVDAQEAATGCRYADVATGAHVDYQVPGGKAGSVATMLAVFGLKTLFTNTASSNRNSPGDSPFANDVEAIKSRMAEMKDGQWDEPSEGPRGPKYDNAVLAAIFGEVLAKKGKQVDLAKIEQKLTDDGAWKRGVLAAEIRKDWSIRQEYAKRQGVTGPKAKSVDELAAGL